jgi:hypothetical protein
LLLQWPAAAAALVAAAAAQCCCWQLLRRRLLLLLLRFLLLLLLRRLLRFLRLLLLRLLLLLQCCCCCCCWCCLVACNMMAGTCALERAWLHFAGALQARDSYWPCPDPALVERRLARLARDLCAELDRVQPRELEEDLERAAPRGRGRARDAARQGEDVARLVASAQVLVGQWLAAQPGTAVSAEPGARFRLAVLAMPDMVEARLALAELSLRHAWPGAREEIARAARAALAGGAGAAGRKRARVGHDDRVNAVITGGAVSEAAWRERQLSAKAQAMYTCALVELSGGSSRSADALLSELGFRYRLSDAVFSSAPPKKSASPACGFLRVLDGVLCAPELELLQRCFGPRSAYWSAQQYDHPACGHVSHVVCADRLVRARHCVERVILERLLPLAEKAPWCSGSSARPLAYCEWWAHRRDATPMHYGCDEGSLKHGLGLKHPEVSLVLYLGATGSPTLVTCARFGDLSGEQAFPLAGELCFPRDNRVLMFDGALLHGVVPRPGLTSFKDETRVTLMVRFWADDVMRVPYVQGLRPQANMEVPDGSAGPDYGFPLDEWPMDSVSTSSSKKSHKKQAHKQPSAGSTVHVPHVWQRIQGSKVGRMSLPLEQAAPSMFVDKYFVRSLAELDAETALYAFPSWPSLEQLATRLMGGGGEKTDQEGEHAEHEDEEDEQPAAADDEEEHLELGEPEEESEERMGMQLAFALNSLVRVWSDERDDSRSDERDDSRSDERDDSRSDERDDSRSDERDDSRSDERDDSRSDERDDSRSDSSECESDNCNDEIRAQVAQLLVGLCARHERARTILANSRAFRDELRDRIRGNDAMACALAWIITRDPAARGPLLQNGLHGVMEETLLDSSEQDEDSAMPIRHSLAGALAYCEQERVTPKELAAALAAHLRQLAEFEQQQSKQELWPGFHQDVAEHVDALNQLASREPVLLDAIRADPLIARMIEWSTSETAKTG